ncbi:SDR family NAD(P)-dependent oxidoreductase [Roseomonas sp. BN140053]|uniref:SDR family NAD(P)-dependent oxidoreductase n=1 Tax=Roseomonas sp. BN140053 TaxID=3391898 RepID=UPI0039E9D625
MTDVAIVTGGAGSIGRAMAEEFAGAGLHVVAADLKGDAPPGGSFVPTDVTDPHSVQALFRFAAEKGSITRLVVAHGVLFETNPGAQNFAAVGTTIDVNLKGVAFICDVAGAYMADGASIVLISSMSAFLGRIRGSFAYQSTKAGVEAMTRAFAVAYAPRGVRVNAIAPGFVSQPMQGEGAVLRERQGGAEAASKHVPLGRLVTPSELAKGAAFLSSDHARSITGVVLPMDGGTMAY